MKNFYAIFFHLFFLGLGFSTAMVAQQIDGATIVGQQLIATKSGFKEIISNDWEPSDSTIYFYNDAGQAIEKINLSYQDTEWVRSSRTLFTYSEIDNQRIETFQWWREGKWIDKSRYLSEMDDAGNETLWQYQENRGNAWRNVLLELKTYNANRQLLNLIRQFHSGGKWVNQYSFQYEYDLWGNLIYKNSKQFTDGEVESQVEQEYNYDADQRLILEVYKKWKDGKLESEYEDRWKFEIDSIPNGFIASEFTWENNRWEFGWQETFLYNNQNHLILHQKQGIQNEILVNLSKDTFVYNAQDQGRIKQIISFQGNLAAWEAKKQINYTYNNQGLLTSINQEKWDGNNWYSTLSNAYDFNYSVEGRLIKKTAYSARFNEAGSTGSFFIYFRNISYYNPPLSVSLDKLPTQPNFSLSIFPNPTQNHFYVHLDPIIGTLSLKIFNAKGQLMQEDTLQKKLNFVPTAGLTKGVYFVHLTNGQQQIVRKIIIE